MSFHEVEFPLRLALGTSGGPTRRTDIVSLSNGREARNSRWKNARRRYDAGSGIRSVSDLYEVVAFFEARSGQLHGFRFRDPIDFKSCGPLETVSALDQVIGTGDGERVNFDLRKTYADAGGSKSRAILKPVIGSVLVAVDGIGIDPGAASADPVSGEVTFAAPPADGAVISAGYLFDVPVRFDTDRIEVNLDAFSAGRIPSIPLIEILP